MKSIKEELKQKMVEEQQRQLDYPCKLCEKLSYFVSTLRPKGNWVCTSCQMTISNDSMNKWIKGKAEIIKKGYVVRVGMNIVDRRIKKEEKWKKNLI